MNVVRLLISLALISTSNAADRILPADMEPSPDIVKTVIQIFDGLEIFKEKNARQSFDRVFFQGLTPLDLRRFRFYFFRRL